MASLRGGVHAIYLWAGWKPTTPPWPKHGPAGIGAADRIKTTLWIESIVLAVSMSQLVAGYVLGNNATLCDARFNEACKAELARCRR